MRELTTEERAELEAQRETLRAARNDALPRLEAARTELRAASTQFRDVEQGLQKVHARLVERKWPSVPKANFDQAVETLLADVGDQPLRDALLAEKPGRAATRLMLEEGGAFSDWIHFLDAARSPKLRARFEGELDRLVAE